MWTNQCLISKYSQQKYQSGHAEIAEKIVSDTVGFLRVSEWLDMYKARFEKTCAFSAATAQMVYDS